MDERLPWCQSSPVPPIKRLLQWSLLVGASVVVAYGLYTLIGPRSSTGPLESDDIFYTDDHGWPRVKPNLRDARCVIPGRPHPLPFRRDDDEYVARITKRIEHFCSTNEMGLRGVEEYSPGPPPGVTRVVTVGDSITFGYGVADHETYPATLGRLLEQHGRYEVINGGLHGYESRKALVHLEDRLLPLNPAIVVICVGVNDTVAVPEHSISDQLQLALPPDRLQLMEGMLAANLADMIHLSQRARAQVVLMVPPTNGFFPFPDVVGLNEVVRSAAQEHQLPLVDLEGVFLQREMTNGLVLHTLPTEQTLTRYVDGAPEPLLTAQVEPDRFQYVSDEVYAYLDSEPVAMSLAFDGSHPNAEGARVIAELLTPVILEMVQ
jgi:lysophospholipase L1-like esterase